MILTVSVIIKENKLRILGPVGVGAHLKFYFIWKGKVIGYRRKLTKFLVLDVMYSSHSWSSLNESVQLQHLTIWSNLRIG
jgi:hypothetical protein